MVEAIELTDEQLQQRVLTMLDGEGEIADSANLVSQLGTNPRLVDAALKSLNVDEYVNLDVITLTLLELTAEGKSYQQNGTPEFQYMNSLEVDVETPKTEVEAKIGAQLAKIGFQKAMQNKWIQLCGDKKQNVKRIVKEAQDVDRAQLDEFASKARVDEHDKKVVDMFKKRKLIQQVTQKSYKVTKGVNFAPQRIKLETNLTAEMLRTGAWKETKFKRTNLNAAGQVPQGGHLHPLLKVRAQFREILLAMGFNEMPTNKWVESSFWNFDSLFQPQSHPARDMHDTFFLTNPAKANRVPEEYKERVRRTHESGLEGSVGYGPGWSAEETMKNILRTHTTAISSQMLYNQAQEKEFRPMKYFSIDRVFRNETLDATHLAEFHQVEGVVVDRGIGLSHLLGVMNTFFNKIGISQLKFKPAYNPYTEPSLEIFAFHPQLKKWIEIGNSGVFRPEMLIPMGLPKDVSVIAWGLSLERPTMIYYNVKNIRELFGSKVLISHTKKNPIAYIKGYDVNAAKKDEEVKDAKSVLDELEGKLRGSAWLGGLQPSAEDREALAALDGQQPDPVSHPHTFSWYALASKFTEQTKKTWKKAGGDKPAAAAGGDKKKGGKQKQAAAKK